MERVKKVKSLMKLFVKNYAQAMHNFCDIVNIIDFEGFGEDSPDILTLSDGSIIVTYDDVDIELEVIIPYLNKNATLSKESWYKIILNINPSEN